MKSDQPLSYANLAKVPSLTRRRPNSRVTSQLYYNIASLRVTNDPIVIQFVAATGSEGTSLLSRQFAAFAAGVEGGSALLIDCAEPVLQTPDDLPTLADVFVKTGSIDGAVGSYDRSANLYGARLSNHPNSSLQTSPGALSDMLNQARKRYQVTVLDTPALNDAPGSLVFVRTVDGVVLVLEAEKTSITMAEDAIETIERSGGKVIGIIFNKRRMHMPRWLWRWF